MLKGIPSYAGKGIPSYAGTQRVKKITRAGLCAEALTYQPRKTTAVVAPPVKRSHPRR